MNCPACEIAQKEVPFRGTRIQVCPNCGSRSLTTRSLAHLLGDADLDTFWKAALKAVVSGNGRSCPNCRKKMKLMATLDASRSRLELDICFDCNVIWFDPGEIERLRLAKNPQYRASPAPKLSPAVQKESDERERLHKLGLDPDSGRLYRNKRGQWVNEDGSPRGATGVVEGLLSYFVELDD